MAPRFGTRVVGGVAVLAVVVIGYLVKRHLSGKKSKLKALSTTIRAKTTQSRVSSI